MSLYCDHKATISIAHNSILHDKTMQIEVDRNFIKEKIQSGQICMPFLKTKDQLADLFTKRLGDPCFHKIVGKLGMSDTDIPA